MANSSASPQRPTGTTNELAKERNRAAAERTMTAWITNALTLIGTGVAFDQINQALRQRFPEESPLVTDWLVEWTGVGFIMAGIAVLGVALAQHRLVVKSINHHEYVLLSVSRLNQIATTGIVGFGLLGAIVILFIA